MSTKAPITDSTTTRPPAMTRLRPRRPGSTRWTGSTSTCGPDPESETPIEEVTMITRRRALQLIGFGGAVGVGAGRRGYAAEFDEVKIGTPLVISDAPIVIAEAKGYCREQGIRTTVINLVTGSQMVAPLGAGQIDIAA